MTSATSGEQVLRSFDDIAPRDRRDDRRPQLRRDGLVPKTRELTACAALAGSLTSAAEKPLEVHITGALAAGATEREVIESLLNVTPYHGFPTVQRAIEIASETPRDNLRARSGDSPFIRM